jgi:hypothetical protein
MHSRPRFTELYATLGEPALPAPRWIAKAGHTDPAGVNEEPTMNLRKPLIAATLALAGTLAAGTAQAGDVQWSIGVNLPVHPHVSVGVFSAPPVVYRPVPVYGPAVVYAPAPRVVYAPAPVYARRAPVYVHDQRWGHGRKHKHHRNDRRDRHDHDRWDRHDDRWDGRRH